MNRRYKTCLKILMLTPAAALVSGCMAMPTAFTIASLAADGISLAATGKSVGMNALSMATNKDCSFGYVLDGIDVCQDLNGNDPITLLALSTPSRAHSTLDFNIDDMTIQLEADPLYDLADQGDVGWRAVDDSEKPSPSTQQTHQADFDEQWAEKRNAEKPVIMTAGLQSHIGSFVSP